MLAHPTYERLIALGLPGMAKAFEDQRRSSDIAALSFEERLGLLVCCSAGGLDPRSARGSTIKIGLFNYLTL